MTYVSRAVRSLREDPIEGESVALALTTADDAVETTNAIAISTGEATDEDVEFEG